MYIEVEQKLTELQRKINKIEDEDSDFIKNDKWKRLRQQQDALYDFLRQEKEEDEHSM